MKKTRKVLAVILAMTFAIALVPITAFAAEVGTFAELQTAVSAEGGAAGDTVTLSGDITDGASQLTIGRSLTLDLAGNDLTINVSGGNGIKIATGVTLTVKDSVGGGILAVQTTEGYSEQDGSGAGINVTDGALVIESGIVNATGASGGAGIGGGRDADCGSIVIKDGRVTATGGGHPEGAPTLGGAGIGCGAYFHYVLQDSDGEIQITGGTVIANGADGGAGIGGGYLWTAGTITISGGDVTAFGEHGGAGIGGGVWTGSGGNISISGDAVIEAVGGGGHDYTEEWGVDLGAGAGIGGGGGLQTGTDNMFNAGSGGTITISGDVTVIATGGTGGVNNGGGAGIGSGGATIDSETAEAGDITIDAAADVTAAGGASAKWKGADIGTGGSSNGAGAPFYAVTINIPPAGTTITEGKITESLTVAATADHNGILSYKWFENSTSSNTGGTEIENSNSASFAIPTGLSEGTYYYYCVVSAPGATSVHSSAAAVTVVPPVLITDITVTSSDHSITTKGGTLQMAVTAEPSNAANDAVVWSISNGSGAMIDTNGLLTATANGTVTVRATATDGSNVYGEKQITITGQETPAPTTCTVTFNSNGGTAVTSITNVTSGNTISEPIAPTRAGYTFGGWYKETALTTAWNFAADTVTASITLHAKWNSNGGGTPTPGNPSAGFSGGNGYIRGSASGLVFIVQKDFSLFQNVRVNTAAITRNRDYTAESGSTKITLLPACLDTLQAGTHTLTVNFTDGTFATGSFTITASAATESPAETHNPNTGAGDHSGVPQTGDNSNMSVWIILLGVSVLSLAGIVLLYRRRQQKDA